VTDDRSDEQAAPDSVAEIEAERERRLAPENRPENSEVDNTGKTLPTVEEFDRRNADEDPDAATGRADPSEVFREQRPDDDEIREIEAERERRLAPENRPENSEVDNTGDRMPDVARD
jgi:hypothetical protein